MGVVVNAFFAFVDASRLTTSIVAIIAAVVGLIGGWVASGDAAPWPADDLRNGPLGAAMIAAIVLGFGAVFVLAVAGGSREWAAGLSGAATVVIIAFAFPPSMRRRSTRVTRSR
jgi:hypothetical protein